jgi:hypothetical protein
MDRHKYVKIAYHGFREMSRDDRLETYGNAPSRDTYDEPDYALIDTLFSLAEVSARIHTWLIPDFQVHTRN